MTEGSAGNIVEEVFFQFEERCSRSDIEAFARVGAYDCLMNGVGQIWDHYYHGDVVAKAMREVGLTGVVAPTLQDLSGPGKDAWVDNLGATQAIQSDLSFADNGIFAALGPHATDTVSEALWRRTLKWSEQWGIPIHAHLAQSIEELNRAEERHGCSPTTWLNRLGVLDGEAGCVFAHGLFSRREDLAQLDPRRHSLVFCPYSQLIFGFPAPLHLWEEMGMNWVVATDCAANNDGNNVQQELRMVAGQGTVSTAWSPAYADFFEGRGPAEAVWQRRCETHQSLQSVMTSEALLSRIWSRPGAMHPKFRVGQIAVNALANLIVWDTEHPAFWPPVNPLRNLAMSDPIGGIHALIVAGKWVGTPGDFHRSLWQSDDYAAARTEANDRLAALNK
jgi:cytosine/adenosine deaminase-related metal-dependent hydrolase